MNASTACFRHGRGGAPAPYWLAISIAQLSGIRLVLLDRFDVLQPPARPQALKLLLTLTCSGDLDSAVMAETMRGPMAKVPAGIQQVCIQGGVIRDLKQA